MFFMCNGHFSPSNQFPMDKIKTRPTFFLLIILFLLEIQNDGLNGLQIAIHMNIFPGKYKHCRFEALSKHFICMSISG